MKRIILTAILLFCISLCFAQKPAVDYNATENWSSVGSGSISNDGKYVTYVAAMNTMFRGGTGGKSVIKQAKGNWEKTFPAIHPVTFSDDNRTAVILVNDSLCLVKLGTSVVECIANTLANYKLFSLDKQHYIILRKTKPERALVIRNLTTGKEQTFTDILDYVLSPRGDKMVLNMAGGKDSGGQGRLSLLDLRTGKQTPVFTGYVTTNCVFSKQEDKLAFSVLERVGNGIGHAFYIYTAGKGTVKAVSSQSPGMDTSATVESISHFSKDGNRLFFTVKTKAPVKLPANGVMVDVWSYRDVRLQLWQLDDAKPNPFVIGTGLPDTKAVADLATGRVIRLEQDGDKPMLFPEEITDDHLFVNTGTGEGMEAHWNSGVSGNYYQVDTKTGDRRSLGLRPIGFRGLSAGGKYVMAKDKAGRDYFAINVLTGKAVNVTGDIQLLNENTDYSGDQGDPAIFDEIAGWTANDEAVLVHDKYDIWKLDPEGIKPPVNLTGGYGRRNHIMLRVLQNYVNTAIKDTEPILLCAFNEDNKDNGFYSLQLNKPGNPTLLTMGPYLYFWPNMRNYAPAKARDTNTWIVSRQSAGESPNYFTTTDFKTFTPVSNEYPEKKYNWLTAELMSWKDDAGKVMQGVLYKPENFDPTKKYPLIFDYYEKRTQEKNIYHGAELSGGRISIPWFVSRGYLVYTPDIYYTKGEAGKSALKAVVGAAKMLSAYPWVDVTKMGIQGHSFGGQETNYIVAHTDMFAAAMSASGVSDNISLYNTVIGPVSNQYMTERGQLRIGATLWEKPNLYIENSPVLRADKINTPLLLMSNKGDPAVPFTQGLELFLSLRRLGKRAWLLQYDGEEHGIVSHKGTIDYTTRMDQFFDHYLKGAPAPKWMLKGIPAAQKGIDAGLELSTEKDANGNPVTPGPGLLIN